MQSDTPLYLEVRSLSRFVDDDSSPLLTARLHPDAAEVLEARATEQRPTEDCVIRVASGTLDLPAAKVSEAVRSHFAAAAEQADHAHKEHRRNGLKALAIALLIIAALFAGAESLHTLGEKGLYRLLSESLVIIAWVTLWIPVEALIFENLAKKRRRNTLRALSKAKVEVVHLS